jgi:hypothetical protein
MAHRLVSLLLVVCLAAVAAADLQLTAAARRVYTDAKTLAHKDSHAVVGTAHVALVLFAKDGVGAKLATRAGGDVRVISIVGAACF